MLQDAEIGASTIRLFVFHVHAIHQEKRMEWDNQ